MSRFLRGDVERVGRRGWRQGFRPTYRFRFGAAFQVGPATSSWIIEVPADFVFDVSAPWWLAWPLDLVGWSRLMVRPAGLHDWARRDRTFSLWFGNLLFVDAMKAEGGEEPALTVCWWAVRTNRNR